MASTSRLIAIGLLLAIAQAGPAPTPTFSQLPPGCGADNALRAIRGHTDEVYNFCSSILPPDKTAITVYTTDRNLGVVTKLLSDYATASATQTVYYRASQFTNVYRANKYDSTYGRIIPPPVTYTNNQPSTFTQQNVVSTPAILRPFNIFQIFTACTCVFAPTQTITSYTQKTIWPSPADIYTPTTYIDVSSRGPSPTYAALCGVSALDLYATIQTPRPARTISPMPTVRLRADCCQLCADTINCLWYKFDRRSGACQYAWATDVVPQNQSAYDQCPNGYGGAYGLSQDSTTNNTVAYGLGTCSQPDGYRGEDQSVPGSTEAWCASEKGQSWADVCEPLFI